MNHPTTGLQNGGGGRLCQTVSSRVFLLFSVSSDWGFLNASHKRPSVVGHVSVSESGLLRLKSDSLRSLVNAAALRWWVNEGGSFLLSQV